jgi:DNA-binding CsgD family transcriptional regulator
MGDERSFENLLHRAVDLARRSGELGTLTEALGMLSVHLALLAQRYDESSIAASEAVRLARDLHAESLSLVPRSALAVLAAIRGDDDAARHHGEHVIQLAQLKEQPFRASPAVYALAMVDMARARWHDAVARLDQLADTNDPVAVITAPDAVEAAVRAGQPQRAHTALALYEARADSFPSPAIQARLASCRALLASGDDATRLFESAIERLDDARPFDRARIQLLAGEHLRRRGQRTSARRLLRNAHTEFEDIGAQPWADRAHAELRATGGTARKRTPDTSAQLTPQEQQIARLVSQGLTNKEVATELYLSPRTIDAHLRAMFAKLGITSRRELRTAAVLPGARTR